MFVTNGCVLLLAIIASAEKSSGNGQEYQTALNNLISRFGAHNNSSDNLVFMPPTFSVDIVSLLRWAVENTQSQKQDQKSQPKEVTSTNYYDAKLLLNLLEYNGKSYFISKNQKLTWMESLSFCRSFGMDLVSIETAEEDKFLINHITSLGISDQVFWTSGNKVGRSTFLWMNGKQLIYENWQANEPNLPATEHCIVLAHKKWYDWPCGQNKEHHFDTFFICEER